MVEVISRFTGNGNPARVSYGRPAGEGYRYVFKHGLGPLVMPDDVGIISGMDLSNGLVVVNLDRVLSGEELKKFDIPSETENSKYLNGVIGL